MWRLEEESDRDVASQHVIYLYGEYLTKETYAEFGGSKIVGRIINKARFADDMAN